MSRRIVTAREMTQRFLITAQEQHPQFPVEQLDPHKTYDWTSSVQRDGRLMKSMQAKGVQQPVEMETDGHLGILGDGNHRLAAAKLLGMSHLPVKFTKMPTRYLSRGGGVPLHPDIQAHLAANPHQIVDLADQERQESWAQQGRTAMADYDDYAGHHQSPGPGTGFPIHDMHSDNHELGGVPEDWQTHPQYYAYSGEAPGVRGMKQTQQMYNRVNGHPDEMVDIYRALPHGNTTFNKGDWVTPSLAYARGHAMSEGGPEGDLPVIKSTVPAQHLWQNGDSYYEMGYHGPSHQGTVVGQSKMAAVDPSREDIEAHPDYLYHATNDWNAADIADHGALIPNPHDYGTDQDAWPDGSTDERSYWTHNPQHARSFYPTEDGQSPVLLRAPRSAAPFKRESTGDVYTTAPVAAHHLEQYAGGGQWSPLSGTTKTSTNAPQKIYRGLQVDLPHDLEQHAWALDKMPLEPEQVGQHLGIGPALLDHLQNAHPGRTNEYNPQPDLGIGRHWTTSQDFADTASRQGGAGGRGGHRVVIEADHPGQEWLDSEHTGVGGSRANGHVPWASEEEQTLRPGAPLNVTSVKWNGKEVLHDPHYQQHMEADYGVPYNGGPRQVTAAVEGLTFRHSPGDNRYCPKVEAFEPGIPFSVGSIAWQPHDGEVEYIETHRDHQRQGIGTALFNHAQSIDPRVHHSDTMSADGAAFAQSMGHDTSGSSKKMAAKEKSYLKGGKCKYCKADATKSILHSEGMAYVQTCDKHLQKGKDAASACVPFGDPDPANIDKIYDLATKKVVEASTTPEGYTFHEVVPGQMWKAYYGPRDPYTNPAAKLVVEQHEGQPFVSNISVHPDHRGKGLGAALWNMAGRPLHVPGAQTDEGKAWADKVGGDNLWWEGNQHLRESSWYHEDDFRHPERLEGTRPIVRHPDGHTEELVDWARKGRRITTARDQVIMLAAADSSLLGLAGDAIGAASTTGQEPDEFTGTGPAAPSQPKTAWYH